ncbi:interleukin-1 beta [Danio rerio]|uniref:Interleukin-1 n=2 Tax=Danio rerio TaxID=7955 RepID=A0A8M1PI54_DANRE|nr:interleukin-1 beta [Danio rerio]|eukprot:NP_998009.2 interleukin-1 beta [Danio rerio]
MRKQRNLTSSEMMACGQYEVTIAPKNLWETDGAVYSDSDEMDCSDPLAMSYRCDMHEGIRLEMWTSQHKMKQLVNVIIALNRMKHIKPQSTEFGEKEVLDMLMANVIQEREVNVVDSVPSYTKTKNVLQCTICDQYKKSLVRSGGSPHLQAVTLRAGSSDLKVRFSMSTYASPSAPATSAQPVCLGISKSNLYLACSPAEGSAPHLVLKEISGSLETIKAGDPNGYDQLLFFRKETGSSINTFESVKCPGWFISTAYEDSQMVEMDRKDTERIINFELQDKVRI